MFDKVVEAKKLFTERQRLQDEEERERKRQEDQKRQQEQDVSEGEKSLGAAIEAWNTGDAATANQLFERASTAFRRSGKLDRVRMGGVIDVCLADAHPGIGLLFDVLFAIILACIITEQRKAGLSDNDKSWHSLLSCRWILWNRRGSD